MNEKLDFEIKMAKSAYDRANAESQKYYDLIFRTINIYIVFFSTATVFALDMTKVDLFAYQVIFLVVIPLLTYIFSLFYCYYIYAVAKVGYFMAEREKDIEKLCKENHLEMQYSGWELYARTNRNNSVLPYASIIVLQIIVPIGSSLIGLRKGSVIFFQNNYINIAIIVMLVMAFIGYLVCLILLIHDTLKMNNGKMES